jgi:FAD/FMN-containing dehydrogenase
VHKNSAGYYIWNVEEKSQNLKNSSGLTLPGLPGGTHTVQNSSGFDFFNLNKLLVGSQGTLGIVTEITFKVVPNFKYSKLVVIFMNDLAPLGNLVDSILELNPETLETYDDKTLKLAVRFFPDFLKNKGFFRMIRFMWSFLPELRMMLTGGFPKLILLAEFAGENETEVNKKCVELKNKIENFKLKVHITKGEEESEKYWDIRRESFSLLRKHVKGLHTAPFIDDIIVRPEFLPKFIPELNKLLGKYDLTYTIAGHAGDGNFHIIPLMDFSRPDTAKIIMELGELVYDLVIKYEGSITAEHNDGIIRTPYLEKMYGKNIISIFRQIKKIFDPQDIFNPGKKIAAESGIGTKDYISSHIAKEYNIEHKV